MDPAYGVLDVHIDGVKVDLVPCDTNGADFY